MAEQIQAVDGVARKLAHDNAEKIAAIELVQGQHGEALARIQERQDEQTSAIEGLSERMDGLNERVDGLSERMEVLEQKMDDGFEDLQSLLNTVLDRLPAPDEDQAAALPPQA